MARHDLTREDILAHALRLMRKYRAEGMTLTLRQMYYQFVAGGICPSGQLHYKRIGDVLTDARYDGSYPIEGLEDRGRSVAAGEFTRFDRSTVPAMEQAGEWLRAFPELTIQSARWAGQPNHVSVWVEKQALEGVFEPVCSELGVSWFACKGYPSVSALWQWLQQAHRATAGVVQMQRHVRHEGRAERCVVLYFGDHDPDGWEIPRSAERNLRQLMQVKRLDIDIEFRRIALLGSQVAEHNPPPFEAKVTSARYAGYIEEHGTEEAWELDALEPTVLRNLIRTNVAGLFDVGIREENKEKIEELRGEMREQLRDPSWAASVLAE